jgi:cytochrome oxidase Cu insertion factor (SCO1/SenC/PrrC family)
MNRLWLLGLGIVAVLLIALGSTTVGRKSTTTTTAGDTTPEIVLKNYGPAPELNNTVWLNTDEPLRLADLRGKVTLIDFWTFG